MTAAEVEDWETSIGRPTRTARTCIHHWVIDEPNGAPLLAGTCKQCGVTREFYAAEQPTAIQDIHRSVIGGRKRTPRIAAWKEAS